MVKTGQNELRKAAEWLVRDAEAALEAAREVLAVVKAGDFETAHTHMNGLVVDAQEAAERAEGLELALERRISQERALIGA